MACTHITVGHYVEWFLGPSWALISILIFIVYFEYYYVWYAPRNRMNISSTPWLV